MQWMSRTGHNALSSFVEMTVKVAEGLCHLKSVEEVEREGEGRREWKRTENFTG